MTAREVDVVYPSPRLSLYLNVLRASALGMPQPALGLVRAVEAGSCQPGRGAHIANIIAVPPQDSPASRRGVAGS
jgi:hypothetical protein